MSRQRSATWRRCHRSRTRGRGRPQCWPSANTGKISRRCWHGWPAHADAQLPAQNAIERQRFVGHPARYAVERARVAAQVILGPLLPLARLLGPHSAPDGPFGDPPAPMCCGQLLQPALGLAHPADIAVLAKAEMLLGFLGFLATKRAVGVIAAVAAQLGWSCVIRCSKLPPLVDRLTSLSSRQRLQLSRRNTG
jgi:hypothetical protein